MAQFSNSSDGAAFDNECSTCKFGENACPIAVAQTMYNYDQVNNEAATAILNTLVENDGTCKMKKLSPEDFIVDARQLKMEV